MAAASDETFAVEKPAQFDHIAKSSISPKKDQLFPFVLGRSPKHRSTPPVARGVNVVPLLPLPQNELTTDRSKSLAYCPLTYITALAEE